MKVSQGLNNFSFVFLIYQQLSERNRITILPWSLKHFQSWSQFIPLSCQFFILILFVPKLLRHGVPSVSDGRMLTLCEISLYNQHMLHGFNFY